MTNYQKIFDDLIAGPDPVRMRQGGGIGSTLREDRGSRTTGRGGRGSVAPQFRSTPRNITPEERNEPGTLPVGSMPNQITMVPLPSKNVPTPLTRAELNKIRTRDGFQKFPGGVRPYLDMQRDKLKEIQARGFKFGNYADDKEMFERMLKNSGFAQKLGAGVSGLFRDNKERSIRRFVYDPKREKILAFESEAPFMSPIGGILQLVGGSSGKKPMVFTGNEDLNFLKSFEDDDSDQQYNPPFNPCPPGFVLKNGVCTPLTDQSPRGRTNRATGIPGFEMPLF